MPFSDISVLFYRSLSDVVEKHQPIVGLSQDSLAIVPNGIAESNSKIYAYLAIEARKLIYNWLGYTLPEQVLQRHESFARILIHDWQTGKIERNEFDKEFTEIIKLMRNAEMKDWHWVSRGAYSQDLQLLYKTENYQFKEPARNRLQFLLNKKPDPRYSVESELLLRQLFTLQNFNQFEFTEIDVKAATIALYRELFFTKGEQFADAMPLYFHEKQFVFQERY